VQEKTLLEVFFVPFELAPLFPAHFDNNRLPLQPVVVPSLSVLLQIFGLASAASLFVEELNCVSV